MAPSSASMTPFMTCTMSTWSLGGCSLSWVAWHDAVEFLDAGRELLGVGKLFLYVFLYALLDLLGTDAVRVYGVGYVVHNGLQLHKVSRLQELDDLLALVRHLFRKDAPAAAIGLHAL